jgi:hypothetical protein
MIVGSVGFQPLQLEGLRARLSKMCDAELIWFGRAARCVWRALRAPDSTICGIPFASHFAMRRGDLYALTKILGHRSPKITLDRYAHLSPEFVHAQKGIMDGMYTGGRSDGHLMDSVRKNRRDADSQVIEKSGAPGEIRTPDPLVRSQMLYPAELRARAAILPKFAADASADKLAIAGEQKKP